MRRFAHPVGTTFAAAARWLCGLSLVACGSEPDPTSSLAERARAESARQTSQTQAADAAPTSPGAASSPPASSAPASDRGASDPTPPDPTIPDPSANPSADPSTDLGTGSDGPIEPQPDTPPVLLKLALDPKIGMRVTTVGMVQLPVVEKPTGFAIQEAVTLDGCKGKDAARTCRLHHRYTNFEAEPPAGRFLETDHARVASTTFVHDIGADGRALSPTTIEGELDEALREPLSRAHALHCLRFLPEPVKVGATWTDTCHEWARGAVGTREVTWTLARVDEEEGVGRRAELRYRGTITQPSKAGDREGTVQGVLYFFADAGQPHLLREQIAMPLKAGGAVTKTTLNIQFARVDPGKPDTLLRMDGRPFPAPPQAAPGSATASAEAGDAAGSNATPERG